MCRERAPLRAGYMGHLTEIANSLQAVAARRPAVARTLCSNAAWTDFAFGPLAERNQVPLQAPKPQEHSVHFCEHREPSGALFLLRRGAHVQQAIATAHRKCHCLGRVHCLHVGLK